MPLSQPSPNLEAERLLRYREDEIWKIWEEQEFPRAFDRFLSKRLMKTDDSSTLSALNSSRLAYRFQRGEYVQVKLKSDDTWSHVLFIHAIVSTERNDDSTSFELIVSKYSFLGAIPSLSNCAIVGSDGQAFNRQELLLHFGDFDSMGERRDAEVIGVNDIAEAQDLEIADSVEHSINAPKDADTCGLFCRFAVRGTTDLNLACLTPVGSKLLSHRERWRVPQYRHSSKPTVFDLSPGVLGLSEGFAQTSCDISAGLGFDIDCNMTWMVRYHSSQVFDENPADVLADFASLTLVPPALPGPEVPKIVVVSGANERFILSDENQSRSSLEDFTRPFESLAAAVKSPALKPDFLVLTMPAAVLHESVFEKFGGTILALLERRYSVHLRKVYLPDHGIPQDRTVIILLAAPLCAAPRWTFDSCPRGTISVNSQKVTVRDVVEDLSFENNRIRKDGKAAFVCKYAPPMLPAATRAAEADTLRCIYNHQTGRLEGSSEKIELDSTAARISPRTIAYTLYPGLGDFLTVRELARIQGFPDDFKFFDAISQQYKQVLEAFPPAIAELIAKTIIRTIHDYRLAGLEEEVDGTQGGVKGGKRLRTEG